MELWGAQQDLPPLEGGVTVTSVLCLALAQGFHLLSQEGSHSVGWILQLDGCFETTAPRPLLVPTGLCTGVCHDSCNTSWFPRSPSPDRMSLQQQPEPTHPRGQHLAHGLAHECSVWLLSEHTHA